MAITGKEYAATKGDVKLHVFRKYKDTPSGKPVLVLVHGSSLSALPSYDVQVPGHGSAYSMMDQFAERGYDVWTLDHEGYGKSSRTASNSNIAMAVDDISAALPILQRETGRSQYLFYGQSSGALRAALFAQKRPQHVERLVLDAFVWTGAGSPTLAKRREGLDAYKASNMRKLTRDHVIGIFTRDKPGTSDIAVAEAVADLQLSYGDAVPTGTYVDMCENLPVVDPTQITVPTLILRGEHDGIASIEDLTNFFERLPNSDKQITVLPGTAHIAHLGLNKHRFYHILFGFLELPARRDKAA
jgi:pimeloyl-ACP methyl ester carboxylesterase